MSIGKELKKQRLRIGLSAEEVAERVGVSPATIYRLEGGYTGRIDFNLVSRISALLGGDEDQEDEIPVFGKMLRQVREDAGMKQNELSKMLGLSRSTINMYERGARQPCLEVLVDIADFFEISIDYLLGRTENRNAHKK